MLAREGRAITYHRIRAFLQHVSCGALQESHRRKKSACKLKEGQPAGGEHRQAGEDLVVRGEQVPLRRFTSFVPTSDTDGNIDELPFLAGQGVGLIHEVLPVSHIVENLIAEAVAVLSLIQTQPQEVGRTV